MILSVDSVSFAYKRSFPVLHDVSFEVPENEVVALVGPNGSGKSTLIKLILDLLHLRDGSIRISGQDNGSRESKMRSMYLASNDYLPEFLTGSEYLHFVASLYGEAIDKAEAVKKFARYQMVGREDELIEDYSHGMRKKLQLIAALVLKRELTIIDETLNGIDLDAAYAFESDVQSLARDGRSVIVCSHDFAMLQRVSQRLLFLAHGFIVTDDTMTEVFGEYGSIDALVRDYLREEADELP
jgi:ABC-2 type transport system ATP-binding protein